MTKREFDLETKRNHGERMFRDERDHYRRARGREQLGSGATARTVTVDRLAERAAWRQWHAGAWAVFLSAFACGCAIAQGSATDGGGPLCCTTQNLCQELAWCNSPSWAACLAGTSPTFDAGGPELCCYQPGLNAPTDAGPMSSANTNCFDGGSY